jgi:hypothetical protein
MDKKILVPMKRNDRVEDFILYVEKVARPGMKVIFMIPYPVEGFRWPREEFGRKATQEAKMLASYYSWDTNVQEAKERILPTSKVLVSSGIEVAADVYAGSVRRAVRDYAAKGDIHLIVTRAGMGERIAGLLNGSSSLFDLFKRPTLSPVLLIHPGVSA